MSTTTDDCAGSRKRARPECDDAVTSVSAELAAFLEQHMASFQCSAHDVRHCYRVARLALSIAVQAEGEKYDLRVVYLAGLLHDVMDSKLVGSQATVPVSEQVKDLLQRCEGVSEERISCIMSIVKSVGYKNLIKPEWASVVALLPREYVAVQDADLLDAIGSIGLTRVFSYGGRKNRPIFGFSEGDALGVNTQLTAEQYAVRAGGSIEHFFDKLLRIRLLLKTAPGVVLGEKRHFRMVLFLRDVDEELLDAGDPEGGRITTLLADPTVTASHTLVQRDETATSAVLIM